MKRAAESQRTPTDLFLNPKTLNSKPQSPETNESVFLRAIRVASEELSRSLGGATVYSSTLHRDILGFPVPGFGVGRV